MPDIDLPTVIFALVALFVAYKLRSVLGTRNDGERRRPAVCSRRCAGRPALSGRPSRRPSRPGGPVGRRAARRPLAGLRRARRLERPRRDRRRRPELLPPPLFLPGARSAYEMVVQAFAAGDRQTLQSLMAPEAFANFDSAIQARAAAGQTMTTTVVSIDGAKIAAAQLVGSMAQVSVRFAAKLASVTRDKAGEVVDGSATEVADHLDLWTFVRDVRSRDPNWRLTETQSER